MSGRRKRKRILFVCTANQHRSRTAEDLYRGNPSYEVNSAGTDVDERDPDERPVTSEVLDWADIVFVMEPYHRQVIAERYPSLAKRVVVLGIEDLYYRGDPVLIKLLESRLSAYLD